jgi:ribose-phosphate pyrophosphokinase
MQVKNRRIVLIENNSIDLMSRRLADKLEAQLLSYNIFHYSNDNFSVYVPEQLFGKHIYLIQSLDTPVHEKLFRLLMLGRIARDQRAQQITAIIPYFSYQRSDKRENLGEPLTAKLIADLMYVTGFSSIICVDLHTPQIEGFFDIPITNIDITDIQINILKSMIDDKSILVAPDLGAVKRVQAVSESLSIPFVVASKQRFGDEKVRITLLGEIDSNRTHGIILDDALITGTTLRTLVDVIRSQQKIKDIDVVVTHGVFVGNYIENTAYSNINTLYMADTLEHSLDKIPINTVVYSVFDKIVATIQKEDNTL